MKKLLSVILCLLILLVPATAAAELSEDNLDPSLFEPAERRGKVELVQYETLDYASVSQDPVGKNLAVYLPPDYDESQQYDVLILLHCAWANHEFWLMQNRYFATEDGGIPVYVPNLLDRMIEEGLCKPLIVVSPCIYIFGEPVYGNAYEYSQFAKEFGKDLMPYLAEHYATYAADGSREAIREAREHFGVLGASFGAYANYLCVIGDNFDLAAWFTFCGGGEIDPSYICNTWAGRGTLDLPLRMLYIAEGEFDDRAGPESSWYTLRAYGGPFRDDNVRLTVIRGWGHEDHSYLVGLYNSLQLFFHAE